MERLRHRLRREEEPLGMEHQPIATPTREGHAPVSKAWRVDD
jgi:hypothetical protein